MGEQMKNYIFCVIIMFLLVAPKLYCELEPVDINGNGNRNLTCYEHLEWLFAHPETWNQTFDLSDNIDAIPSKELNGGKGIVFPFGSPDEVYLNINYNDYAIKNLYFWDLREKRTYLIVESIGSSPINRSKQIDRSRTEKAKIYKNALTFNYAGLTPVAGASLHFFVDEHVKLSVGAGVPAVGIQVDYMFRNTSKCHNNFSVGIMGIGIFERGIWDNSSGIIAAAALVGGYHLSYRKLFLSVHLGGAVVSEMGPQYAPYGGVSLGFRF